MELVSTNPTKPTCSNVSNKRLFIFFLSVFVYYRCVWWCAGRQRERGREKRRETVKNERKRGETRETAKGRRDRNREKDQSMIQAAWVLIAGFYCRVCKLRDRYRWILLRLPPFQVSRLFFFVFILSLFLIGFENKDPRQSLGHTSMFVGTRSADWLKFLFVFFLCFSSKKGFQTVATIIII